MKSCKLLSILLIFGCFCIRSATAQNNVENAEVKLLPNFNEISFDDFDSFSEDGAVPTEFNKLVGRDISRKFQAGDNVEDVLQIGDLEASLAP